MKRISREKNVATLSIVFSMTTNCLLKAGIKRTSLRIRNNRNVRSTETPLDSVLLKLVVSTFEIKSS